MDAAGASVLAQASLTLCMTGILLPRKPPDEELLEEELVLGQVGVPVNGVFE